LSDQQKPLAIIGQLPVLVILPERTAEEVVISSAEIVLTDALVFTTGGRGGSSIIGSQQDPVIPAIAEITKKYKNFFIIIHFFRYQRTFLNYYIITYFWLNVKVILINYYLHLASYIL
jgi:hypothetical protein